MNIYQMPNWGIRHNQLFIIVKLIIRPQHLLPEAETLIIGGAGNVP